MTRLVLGFKNSKGIRETAVPTKAVDSVSGRTTEPPGRYLDKPVNLEQTSTEKLDASSWNILNSLR
jgi:hypothetical protein